jgi:ankyrin repeat protein
LALSGVAAGGRDLRVVNAAKNADWPSVHALVKQGIDVTAPQADRTTALHWAAYWDNRETADLLIRAGASVGAANDLGATPLWLAAENGSAAMARRLLAAGANPNAALLSGETILMTAARTGNLDVVRQLLAKSADVNAKEQARGQTPLMWAVAQQHPDVVEALLKYKADVHARSKTWTQTVKTAPEAYNDPEYIIDIQQGGYTPLLFAARVGDLASAKLLVAAGANVNDAAPYGTSAMVVAAHSGHADVAMFLLEAGGDPNAVGAGYTALHASILHKDEKLVRALLAHGANPNAPVLRSTPTRRDSVDFHLPPAFIGATPFWLAARFSAPKIMRLLAEHGADPLFVQYLAFWGGAPAPIAQLPWVEEGATTTLMAAAGMGGRSQSPLFAIDRLGRLAEDAPVRSTRREPDPVMLEALTLEAVQVAAGLGVDVNAANAEGNTALHAVAARGYDTVVKFLVEKGARLDIKNNKGQTPLDAALAGAPTGFSETGPVRSTPRKSTVELLRKLGATE